MAQFCRIAPILLNAAMRKQAGRIGNIMLLIMKPDTEPFPEGPGFFYQPGTIGMRAKCPTIRFQVKTFEIK